MFLIDAFEMALAIRAGAFTSPRRSLGRGAERLQVSRHSRSDASLEPPNRSVRPSRHEAAPQLPGSAGSPYCLINERAPMLAEASSQAALSGNLRWPCSESRHSRIE
jgi:hypothetical protein